MSGRCYSSLLWISPTAGQIIVQQVLLQFTFTAMKHIFPFGWTLLIIHFFLQGKICAQSNDRKAGIDSSRLYDLFRLANQSARNKHYDSTIRYLDTALLIAPDFSTLHYSRLRSCLRTGRKEDALNEIDFLIRQRAIKAMDIKTDSLVLAELGTNPKYIAAVKNLDLFSKSSGQFSSAYTIPDKAQVPEGITNDPLTKTIYLSSVYQRKIISIDSAGVIKDFIESKQDDVLGVLGLAIDPKKKILYGCSSYTPLNIIKDTGDIRDKHTAVYAYDLSTGSLLHKYVHPDAVFFNDIVVSPDGDVYVTDSDGNSVYKIRVADGSIQPFITRPVLHGANGICVDDKGENLYVAAYLGGVLKVNLKSGAKTWIQKPGNISMAGIDGMEWYRNSLIVNSPTEHKAIRRLHLNNNQTAVVKEEYLAYDPAHINETTTGTIMGNAFYFIMNSGLDHFERDGNLNMQKLEQAVIGKCVLK